MNTFTHILPSGTGYDTASGAFRRAATDTPIRLVNECAKPGHVIGYTESGERIHTRRDLLKLVPQNENNA